MKRDIEKLLHDAAVGFAISCCPDNAAMSAWSKRKEFKLIYKAHKKGLTIGYTKGFQKAIKTTHKILKSSDAYGSQIIEEKFKNALLDEREC